MSLPTLSEFGLIHQFFTHPISSPRIPLGVGDDCALITPDASKQIAISSDMLVSGRHFFPDANPYQLGHKCLAVNLSDLAAMGASPLAFTLSLALPEANASWLQAFSDGMLKLAQQHHCHLIGGDTTKGPLTINITILGELTPQMGLQRNAAQVGDDIWVSGTIGDARLALAHYWKELTLNDADFAIASARMHTPTPRIALGEALIGYARAAIDISDGLMGDLGHILKQSQVGATLNVDSLPFGFALQNQTRERQYRFALAGGDDYELCFTAPPSHRDRMVSIGKQTQTAVTRIGCIEAELGCRLINHQGSPVHLALRSFDHFTSD